ncbi:lipopolysaccharide biosynthesis protein [Methylocystis parvus]|uniref:Lipopolysaccharide biosynthesis protein n=1 Tax=Methylocystis parvus TaxID=134 RepID=A0A6B8M8I8_9HYPH|nr:lipopolysaccharide biosynthesis protein [Methylocystis parvus]
MSVARLTAKSSLWNLFSNLGQQILNFIFFVYTARLLEPSAFGLMALAMVFVDAFAVLGRGGLVEASVQRESVSDELQNHIFWFLQVVGLAATLALYFGADTLAGAFGHPELAHALRWLSPVCLLLNGAAVPEARLQREFGHDAIARSTLAGVSAGGVVGVIAALLGYGVLALVFQKLASVIIQSVLLWRKERWRPRAPAFASGGELRGLLRIGMEVTSANLVLMLNSKLMDVLVGLFLGPTMLGYLRTAWRCFELVLHVCVSPLSNVSLVTFSRVRDDSGRLVAAYSRMVEIAALTIFPIFFGLAAIAPLAMPLVFGEQWAPSAPLVQALSLIAIAGTPNPFFVPMMTATNNTRRLTTQSLIHVVLSILLTATMSPLGVMAVAWAQVVRASAMTGVSLWMMRDSVDVSFSTTWVAMRPALLAAGGMGLAVAWLLQSNALAPLTGWPLLLALIALGGAIYAATLLLGFPREVSQRWTEARDLLRGRVA